MESPFRRTRPPGQLKAPLFLAAAVMVLLAVAAQVFSAVTAAGRVQEKLLHDAGRMAAWSLSQFVSIRLQEAAECAFHGTHLARPGRPLPRTPSAADVLAAWHVSSREIGCQDAAIGPAATLYRVGPGGQVEVTGEAPSPEMVAEVRALLQREGALSRDTLPAREPLRRTEYAAAAMLDGNPYLVLYTRQLVPGGVAVWAVAADRDAAGAVFRQVIDARTLVPEPLLRREDAVRTMGLRFRPHGGAVLFHHPAASGPPVTVAATPLDGALAGIEVEVEISAEARALLSPDGLPPGQAALLAGTLLVSLLLVALAYRQIGREREFARLRDDFVASVSHELRTPLTVQRLYLDMLGLGRLPDAEERARALQGVDRENQRLHHIVENVLRFARSERSQVRLVLARHDLRAAVDRSVMAVSPLAEQRGMTIETAGEREVPVRIDEAAFDRALTNVVDNAIKYGSEGQAIRIALARQGQEAVLTVDDEGTGVPAAEREYVFEPFRRGATAAQSSGGSGIGLSVVRDIVRLHGGSVRIVAAPTGGARVEIRLPLERAAVLEPAHA
jgi:signal transduction histidine kinase